MLKTEERNNVLEAWVIPWTLVFNKHRPQSKPEMGDLDLLSFCWPES